MKTISHLLAIFSALLILLLTACQEEKAPDKVDPAFSQYVSAFTTGTVTRKADFRVRLTKKSKSFQGKGASADGLFSIHPKVEGKAVWVDDMTIDFLPAEPLNSGTEYHVSFNLGKVANVEAGFEKFRFKVHTMIQHFRVDVDNLSPYTQDKLEWNLLEGRITCQDFLEGPAVEEIFKLSVSGTELIPNWVHSADGRIHSFTVDSVERKVDAREGLLEWDATDYNLTLKGETTFEVPSLNDFKIMSIKSNQLPEQSVVITFSDPLDPDQNLKGLIEIAGSADPRMTITGNVVRVYPNERVIGYKVVTVETDIKNIMGYALTERGQLEVSFEEIKPAVRLNGSGVILPSTDGLVFPFEAVNLSHVDVTVTKIFETNVAQFFQVNRIDGNRQMARVGKPVLKKKIKLEDDKPIDHGKWNQFTLDLSELVKKEPGAIYRVAIDFRKSYSLYHCEGEEAQEDTLQQTIDQYFEGDDNWSYYGEYYYDRYDYDWRERDNPCHGMYYRQNRGVSRNLFASNIGLISKRGSDQKIFIAATDIRSTKPLNGLQIEVLDYTQQVIAQGTTDSQGQITLELEKRDNPWLVVATQGSEKGYLKISEGNSLSLSQFDVNGQRLQHGVKGFIYGERGVWRPGDTLFLNFILEDKNKVLPAHHPVRFELTNPQGQMVERKISTAGVDGFYNFTSITDQDAPTGNWTARVHVGGASFSKNVKVETIKPNRLKIGLDFGDKTLSAVHPEVNADLSAEWLHGAPARNLKAKVAVTLSPGRTHFERFPDHDFTDPVRSFNSSETVIFDDRLDSTGHADLSTEISLSHDAPGMLRANFVTRVFEESGDFSIDRFSTPYSPYSKYVGIKMPEGDHRGTLLTDTAHKVSIVTVDHTGKPVASKKIKVRLYQVQWRWWWQSGNDYLGNYVGDNYHNWIEEYEVSTNEKGIGTVNIEIKYPSWGRYLLRAVDESSGHASGHFFYADWPGWVGRSKRANPGGAAMLAFSSDKGEYQVGETATISVPSSAKGRALLTVENGSKILSAEWLDSNGKELVHQLKITPEMAPNCYVSISLVQPHVHDNSLPIRMYGVIPLMVEDPETHLSPVIEMPDELQPETRVSIKVKEEKGKAMTYTLAVVDEGLLDLTRFQTPNAHPVFYAREALGVRTWDMYDDVIGAYGGTLERLLAIGGDGSASDKKKNKINRFKPMVKFLGPFELGAGKSARHDIMMPNYIGRVRTMVVAGHNSAYGRAEKSTPVKTPLMVLATLPRVLGPGESVTMPVTVFAMEKGIRDVKIKVSSNDLFKQEKVLTKKVYFDQVGDQVVNFELKVADKVGKGAVKVEVSSGKEAARYEVELEVRSPNPTMHQVGQALAKAGESTSLQYSPVGVQGTNKVVLEMSAMPPINLEKRLRYLIGYPHGCVEQTTSRAFPQLFLEHVIEMDNQSKEKASQNVGAALHKLKNFQNSDGGFGYWPGHANSSDWASSYVGHFLIKAEQYGYMLPHGMKSDWIRYQKTTAKQFTSQTDHKWYSRRWRELAQAYRLFSLALAGQPEIGAMNRLKADNELSTPGLWRLAAAYHLAGQPKVANSIVQNVEVFTSTVYNDPYTYGSFDRDQAMIMEAMIIMGREAEAAKMMRAVAESLSRDRWMSTQSTAYCLLSVAEFVGKTGTSKEMNFTYTLNGQPTKVMTQRPIVQLTVDQPSKAGEIKWDNHADGPLFIRLVSSGQPLRGEEKSKESHLQMTVQYYDMKDRVLNISSLEQGTDFYVEVSIHNPNASTRLQDLSLTQIFPSGWEIHNARMDGTESVHQVDRPDYQDIRDDRVYTYFDLARYSAHNDYDSKTFRINLSATYLGQFYLPAVVAESMYDREIMSSKSGQMVEVTAPGK